MSGLTESGFQPIGVAVSRFSIKPPAKDVKLYRAFAAPAFELPQVVLIVKKTLIIRCMHAQGVVINAMLCFSLLCFASLHCFAFLCFSILLCSAFDLLLALFLLST